MTVLAITCAKLSVLSLYDRVFVIATFRRWTIIMALACLLWGTATMITVMLKCNQSPQAGEFQAS